MRRLLPVVLAVLAIAPALAQRPVVAPTSPQRGAAPKPADVYFPERFEWQHKRPEDVDMNAGIVMRPQDRADIVATTDSLDRMQSTVCGSRVAQNA